MTAPLSPQCAMYITCAPAWRVMRVRVMTMTYAQVVGGAGHDGAAVAQCTMYITCATA